MFSFQASQNNVARHVLRALSSSMLWTDWPLGLCVASCSIKGSPTHAEVRFTTNDRKPLRWCSAGDLMWNFTAAIRWLTSLMTHCLLLILLIRPFSYLQKKCLQMFADFATYNKGQLFFILKWDRVYWKSVQIVQTSDHDWPCLHTKMCWKLSFICSMFLNPVQSSFWYCCDLKYLFSYWTEQQHWSSRTI